MKEFCSPRELLMQPCVNWSQNLKAETYLTKGSSEYLIRKLCMLYVYLFY